MTVFSLITDNIETLRKQVYDLEMNWVSGKKPSLHPQTATLIRQELAGIKEDIQGLETRTMALIDRMKEILSGRAKED